MHTDVSYERCNGCIHSMWETYWDEKVCRNGIRPYGCTLNSCKYSERLVRHRKVILEVLKDNLTQ